MAARQGLAAAGIIQPAAAQAGVVQRPELRQKRCRHCRSGTGGGGLMLFSDTRRKRLQAWDGRETAPLTASAGQLSDATGKRLDFARAVRDPRKTGREI